METATVTIHRMLQKSEKEQPFMIHPMILPMTNSLRGTKTASIDVKYSLFDVDF